MSSIQEYLDALRACLAGADPAVVQDALYDAEEYLRSETGDTGDAAMLADAIERYGTPDEIAQAYLETERTVKAALRRPEPKQDRNVFARFFGVVIDPAAYAAAFYMFLALATGVAYFTIAVVGLSMSVGTLILVVGLPILLLFIAAVRAVSLAEGRVVEGLLGMRMPRRPRVLGQQGSMLDRVRSWFTDYRTWTTMLYMVLQLPLGVVYFTLLVTALATSVGFVVGPVLQVVTGQALIHDGSAAYYLAPWFIPIVMLAGVLLFVLTLHAAKLIGRAHAAYAKVMLVGRPMDTATTAAMATSAQAMTEGSAR